MQNYRARALSWATTGKGLMKFSIARRRTLVLGAQLAALMGTLGGGATLHAVTATAATTASPAPIVTYPVKQDVSPPAGSLAPPEFEPASIRGKDRKAKRVPEAPDRAPTAGTPSAPAPGSAPTLAGSFQGIGVGLGAYAPGSAPPDPNGSVGPNHYVETVNTDYAVFNKAGALLYGPVPINTLFTGFGGGCEINNDGDPTVVYDRISDRWVISQFSVTTLPYLNCVAVSTSGNPLGTYNRYAYSYADFPDYPKFGVWPDGSYLSFNMFAGGVSFSGAMTCSYNRASMVAGLAAAQVCFKPGPTYGGLLPSSLDGATLPPAGAPNHFVALDTTSSLAAWNFHVDWTTPANSTFAGPTSIAVPAYSQACAGGTCIPQLGTTQQLDSLGDRVMYRLAYRNFGDHEALVVNHSVTAGTSVGVRWYELRLTPGVLVPSLYQQGTFAPDANYRWMGSMAMDKAGDIGLGYSVSSSAIKPGISYTGRQPGDATGTMQVENSIIAGTGSQTAGLSRWGDYTSMAVDPADDCTFYYTGEYLQADGTFNWSTRVGTFKFPSCGTPPPTVSSISPTSGPGGGGTTVTVNGTGFSTTAGATTVKFGSNAATGVSCTSTTACSATSPAGGGVVDVTVTVGGSTSAPVSADQFNYVPVVTSISPTSGSSAGGTNVIVTGTGFGAPVSITFGPGNPATGVSCASSIQCTAVSPAGTVTGLPVDVIVTVGKLQSQITAGDKFTYTAPPPGPAVTSISPTSGPSAGGTTVAVTGTGFSTTGTTTVQFGSTPATGVTCTSSTQCSATSPAGAGSVDVTVTVGGVASSTNPGDVFTYTAPAVTGVNPNSGDSAGGDPVSITGTGFSVTPGATTIEFGPGNPATGVSCLTTTQCDVTSPPGNGTVVDVTVTVGGATSAVTPADQFSYFFAD
ncbi:MAG: hypothetical protein NVS3B18_01590 [Candidatus Dormibacteria bacterium]